MPRFTAAFSLCIGPQGGTLGEIREGRRREIWDQEGGKRECVREIWRIGGDKARIEERGVEAGISSLSPDRVLILGNLSKAQCL